MYPSAFEYEAPTDVGTAVRLLAADEDARVLAGGQSLIPMMKLRFARPSLLVDIGRIPELREVELRDDVLIIGAMVREAALAAGPPVLSEFVGVGETARLIADPLVRNSASLGGNLAHGDPENDQPAMMIALDASLVLHGPGGRRSVAAGDFFQGLYETALEPGEILTQIRLTRPPPSTGSAYVKLRRQVGDFAIVAAASAVTVDGDQVTSCRVVLTGVALTPKRALLVEEWLVGRGSDRGTIARVAMMCAETLELRDSHVSADYLRRVIPSVVGDSLAKSVLRARERR